MKQLRAIRSLNILINKSFHSSARRLLLSPSYYCKDAWAERLNQDVLRKIDPDTFGAAVFDKMKLEHVTTALDMDLLVNKADVASSEMKSFIVDIYARYRRMPACKKMPESTPYAILRYLLDSKEFDKAIEILQQKTIYQVFLDEHLANMFLDNFLKEKDYKRAAAVAYEVMLQEEVGEHPISTALAWKAAHYHWKTGEHAPVVPHEDDPKDDDIHYIRKDYVPTPYYDDHFDIPHDVWKLGKLFVALTGERQRIQDTSYRLVGWALYDKYAEALDLLQSVLDSPDQAVTSDAMATLESRLEGVITKEPPEEPKPVGLQTVADYYPIITQQQKEQYQERCQELAQKVTSASKVQQFDLEKFVEDNAQEAISKHESEYRNLHLTQLKQWEEERNETMKREIETLKLNKRKKAVGEKLRELHLMEEKLRLFEDTKKIGRSISKLKPFVKNKYPKDVRKEQGS